jgi:hypothetical protein
MGGNSVHNLGETNVVSELRKAKPHGGLLWLPGTRETFVGFM